MAAKEARLGALHEKLTDVFAEILECDAGDIPSATLKTISSFLKDNDITCTEEGTGVDGLREKLRQKKLGNVSFISDDVAIQAQG